MLATRPSRPAHLPIPPRELDYSQRPSSSCSTASSSSGSPNTPSLYHSSTTSSGSSSQSASFQEAQHLRRKGSRPLPKIPQSSPTGSPPAESSNQAHHSSLRPLPRPPRSERATSPSLLETPRSAAPAVRPLPTPIQSPHLPVNPNTTITPSQAHCRPSRSRKPNSHPFPSLSIRIDAPGRSTTQIVLESPKGPISPLVFNRPVSLFQGTTETSENSEDEALRFSEKAVIEKEEEVARQLSKLGFVEMEEETRYSHYSDSDDSSYGSSFSSSESTVGTVARPGTSMSSFSSNFIPPPRWDSHRHKHTPSTTSVRTLDNEPTIHYENVIRIELVPAAPPQSGKQKRASRASRMWVREKKGKRWVENDYLEVLSLLRKL
jgi:hypothetical protein